MGETGKNQAKKEIFSPPNLKKTKNKVILFPGKTKKAFRRVLMKAAFSAACEKKDCVKNGRGRRLYLERSSKRQGHTLTVKEEE